MAKPKILLIEDNPQNRVLATFLLEEAGMEVLPAVNGAEALERARSWRPDLILLDIQLPDMDGYELLGRLKGLPEVERIPVVAVTSYAMGGERKRAMELGCAGYIEKPIDTVQFANQVSEFLEIPRQGLSILVVEDRTESALVLRENLEQQGYTVIEAKNGREALQQLSEHPVDLVITDLLMPEMDGYQFTHALKTDERFRKIPVLIYTATYTAPEDKKLALDLGAVDFIVKPAETGAFMRLIAQVLAKAARGELPDPRVAPDESGFLKQYTERLLQKLEDKVLEAEESNRKLSQMNAQLEQRVAEATGDLRETIQRLNSANKDLESFAYTVAHDLRAPLRSVRGLVTILGEDHARGLSKEAQEICRRLIHNADLMDRLIEDLLEYSRLGTGAFALIPVSLNVAVSDALSLLKSVIAQSGAQVDAQPNMPPVIGHQPTLMQIVSNLVSNGIKFVGPGVRPEIHLTAEEKDGRVTLRIRDNGIGIAPESQEKIFDVFERLHDNESYPGTGIGLAVVKKGVQKMGGKCGVESRPGKGSVFWIELPAASRAFQREK